MFQPVVAKGRLDRFSPPSVHPSRRDRRGNTPHCGLALVAVPVRFGAGHWYVGRAGVFTNIWDGFVMGAARLLGGRNLWAAVLTHGLADTIAIVALYPGLAN